MYVRAISNIFALGVLLLLSIFICDIIIECNAPEILESNGRHTKNNYNNNNKNDAKFNTE